MSKNEIIEKILELKMKKKQTKPLIDSGEWEIYVGGPIT